MRFDLVVNAMALNVWKSGKLKILRDGDQWRPMVHVRDTARAFLDTIEQPKEVVSGQIFNVGSNSQNYRIIDLATKVSEALGKELDLEWYGDADHRSYRVSFDKIASTLNFSAEWDIDRAAKEIANALESGETIDELKTRTLNWYQALSEWEGLLSDSRVSFSSVL
jgi:nucleoside-diphosphate-sugar epimerase